MQITRQTEYAFWILIELASNDVSAMSIRQIAEKYHLPKEFLRKTVRNLCRAGLVKTQRGAQGGLHLAKPADKITALHVIEAMDGSLTINPCLSDDYDCPRKPCRLHHAFRRIQEEMISAFSAITIADLAKG